jgi:hypothetical protein
MADQPRRPLLFCPSTKGFFADQRDYNSRSRENRKDKGYLSIGSAQPQLEDFS